ncbi:MAG: maleylpyruvate isomerase family mycothiol-dependent enzyme [Ilumatobacteraceae bacterium]
MESRQHLEAIERDAPVVRESARAAPDAPIAACPGWTAMDLAWHVGEVHHFWATVVADRLADPGGYVEPPRPDTDDGVLAFNEASGRALHDALASTDPATPVWTWSAQHDVAFVVRRMAQETAVHRVDAERAAGRDHRIDAELASDGIDEFLEHFLPDVTADAPAPGGSVHVHCTDVAGEWLVTTDADGRYVVRREHAKGAAAVRGPAHDLLMVLWRRQPLDTVEVIGDRGVAERLVARTNLE